MRNKNIYFKNFKALYLKNSKCRFGRFLLQTPHIYIYMYVCMYVYIYVCMYVYIYVYVYIYMYFLGFLIFRFITSVKKVKEIIFLKFSSASPCLLFHLFHGIFDNSLAFTQRPLWPYSWIVIIHFRMHFLVPFRLFSLSSLLDK